MNAALRLVEEADRILFGDQSSGGRVGRGWGLVYLV